MKSSIKLVLVTLLSTLILLSTGGFSLAKMICLKSGYTSISLNTPEDCCKDKEQHTPFSIKAKCCDISTMNIDALHYLASTQQKAVCHSTIAVLQTPIAFTQLNTQFVFSSSNPVRSDHFPASPPIRISTKSFLI